MALCGGCGGTGDSCNFECERTTTRIDKAELEELRRLARLGAAVEAMPHDGGITKGFADIHADWMISLQGNLIADKFFKTPLEAIESLKVLCKEVKK